MRSFSESRHLVVNSYANAWYITPEDIGGRENYELIVEMTEQRIFYICLAISLVTFIGCIFWGIRLFCKRKKYWYNKDNLMIIKMKVRKYFKSLLLLLRKNKEVILTIILLTIPADIFLMKGSSDFRIFGILGLYIASILFYRLRSRLTFSFSLVLLGGMFVSFIFNGTSESTEKAAVWLFFFLLTGIIQQLKEWKSLNSTFLWFWLP